MIGNIISTPIVKAGAIPSGYKVKPSGKPPKRTTCTVAAVILGSITRTNKRTVKAPKLAARLANAYDSGVHGIIKHYEHPGDGVYKYVLRGKTMDTLPTL